MSFLSRIFGWSSCSEPAPALPAATERYGDCLIRATPMKEGSQYRLAGAIEKEIDGQVRIRTFIRADMFSAQDEAASAALRKAHQIIDQTGPALFADPDANRQV